ncbi:hypothetical protein VTO42DRAFT_2219 [Malbranchea cinnamomea]
MRALGMQFCPGLRRSKKTGAEGSRPAKYRYLHTCGTESAQQGTFVHAGMTEVDMQQGTRDLRATRGELGFRLTLSLSLSFFFFFFFAPKFTPGTEHCVVISFVGKKTPRTLIGTGLAVIFWPQPQLAGKPNSNKFQTTAGWRPHPDRRHLRLRAIMP